MPAARESMVDLILHPLLVGALSAYGLLPSFLFCLRRFYPRSLFVARAIFSA